MLYTELYNAFSIALLTLYERSLSIISLFFILFYFDDI